MDGAFNRSLRTRRVIINITPLIDVMFLLLIFFMVSSTFRHELGIDVSLPQAATSTPQEVQPHEITVDREGQYHFGQQLVDEAGLRAALQDLAANSPNASVVLRADQQADFGRVVRVIDIARQVGANRLIVPTQPADPD